MNFVVYTTEADFNISYVETIMKNKRCRDIWGPEFLGNNKLIMANIKFFVLV